MTDFDFVDELPGGPYRAVRSPNRNLRPETKLLFDFAQALRQRPMTWGKWPRIITSNTAASTCRRVRDGFYRQVLPNEGFESTVRDGELYVRFNPEKVTDARTLAFREGYSAGHKRGINDLSGIVERAFGLAREEIRQVKNEVK